MVGSAAFSKGAKRYISSCALQSWENRNTPRLIKALLKYRKHRCSGQAVVTLSGVDHYLGPHGGKTSRLEYDRLVAEWLQNGRRLRPVADCSLTVVEVMAAYMRHANSRCVINQNAGRIRRMFKWAAAEELLPARSCLIFPLLIEGIRLIAERCWLPRRHALLASNFPGQSVSFGSNCNSPGVGWDGNFSSHPWRPGQYALP